MGKYCSEVVRACHEIFVRQKAEQTKNEIEALCQSFPSESREKFLSFYEKFRFWILCKKIEELKKEASIKFFAYELEDLMDVLTRMRKALEPTLERYYTGAESSRKLIENSNRKIGFHEEELEKANDPKLIKEHEKKLNVEKKCIEKEECKLREAKVSLAKRCDQMVVHENELIKLLEQFSEIRQQTLDYAKNLCITEAIALEIFSYVLNSRYFTYLSTEEYNQLLDKVNTAAQRTLKNHYEFNEEFGLYQLKEDLHYYSVIQEKQIIGYDDCKSGISYLDPDLKVAFAKHMQHLSFLNYKNDAIDFYGFVCEQALEDGILSTSEISQLKDVTEALGLSSFDFADTLNEVAVEIQKKFIQNQLKDVFDMAYQDQQIEIEERNLIMDLKKALEGSIETDLSKLMEAPENIDIQLVMKEEELFYILCQLAKKDEHFANIEKCLIAAYAKKNHIETSQVKEILSGNDMEKRDTESQLWKIFVSKNH